MHGRPLIEYIIVHLARHGFTELGINLHFMPNKVRDFLRDGASWSVRIAYSDEPVLLGTAGEIKRMEKLLRGDDPFLVQYGDVLTDQDLTAMLAFHRERRALATLLLHRRERLNSIVALDEHQRIVGFWERPNEETSRRATSPWVNSGVCICDPEVLDAIPANMPWDLP